MKKYLQLTRAHTAPLEVVPAALGAAVATGSFWELNTLIWGVYGLLYHLAGYGMNSYTDWVNGYDKEDENKSHHPLNTGKMSKRNANVTVFILLSVTILYAVYMISRTVSFVILFIGLLFGFLYNFYGKMTILKFLFISIAHSTVFAVPYIDSGGEMFSITFYFGMLYMLLWIMFQISVSGEIKDIAQDEENLLITLGSGVRDGRLCTSISSMVYAVVLKVATFAALVIFMLSIETRTVEHLTVGALGVMAVYLTAQMMEQGRYMRRERIRVMALIEMVMVFSLIAAVTEVIGVLAGVFLAVGSTTWVIVFNKIEWDTVVGPDV